MENSLRVLHVLGGLNRGGAETMVVNLYRNIDRSKVQFDFIVHTEDKCDYDDEIKSLGGRIYRLPRYTGKNHYQYKEAWRSFFQKHTEYRIVHGHMRSTAAIYLRIAKQYGLITIAHSHNTSSGTGFSATVKNIMQYPIRYIADYFFACSKNAGIWLFGEKVCQKENFMLLYNSIDTKKFIYDNNKRKEKRREFQIEDKFVIGHVGRFHTQKNHKFIVDIFKEIHDKDKSSVLMLVGDGDLRQQIKKKVDDLGLVNSVIFTGVRSDIAELMQAMDVFLFPSLYEGLGIVVIEAQAAGLPCIIADTIPKEAHVTNNIKTLSLKKPAGEWASLLLKFSSTTITRNNISQILSQRGYNIEDNAKWISDFYCDLWKKS